MTAIDHRHPESAPSRVVVLGSRGFVGSSVVRALEERGWPVRPVPSTEIDLTGESTTQLKRLLEPNDTVVLVSALTPDRGRDARTLERNVAMVRNLAEALDSSDVAHLVNIGTDAVYADDANPVRETSCASPSSLHGAMHLTREVILQDVCGRRGIPLIRLRPSLLYGAGDTHNGYGPNRFVRTALQEGRIALFGNGEEKRDHVHVVDVATIVAAVVARGSSGVLNVATGTSHSFREIAEAVAEITPRDVEIVPSARANPITHRHFDVAAALRAFPTFAWTPLRDGLAATVRANADGA